MDTSFVVSCITVSSESNMTFGQRVKEARIRKSLTQQNLAELTGIAQTTLSGIESRNQTKCETENIPPLARALGVNLLWLLNGQGNQEPIMTNQVQAERLSYQITETPTSIKISHAIQSVQENGFNVDIQCIEPIHQIQISTESSSEIAVQCNTSQLQPAIKRGWVIVYDEFASLIEGENIIIKYEDNTFAIAEFLYKRNGVIEADRLNQKGRLSIDESNNIGIFRITAILLATQIKPIKG